MRSLAGVTAFLITVLALAGFKHVLLSILAIQLIAYPSLFVYREAFIRDRVVPFKERMGTDFALIDAYRSLANLGPTEKESSPSGHYVDGDFPILRPGRRDTHLRRHPIPFAYSAYYLGHVPPYGSRSLAYPFSQSAV